MLDGIDDHPDLGPVQMQTSDRTQAGRAREHGMNRHRGARLVQLPEPSGKIGQLDRLDGIVVVVRVDLGVVEQPGNVAIEEIVRTVGNVRRDGVNGANLVDLQTGGGRVTVRTQVDLSGVEVGSLTGVLALPRLLSVKAQTKT